MFASFVCALVHSALALAFGPLRYAQLSSASLALLASALLRASPSACFLLVPRLSSLPGSTPLIIQFIYYPVLASSGADEEEAHPPVIVKPAFGQSQDDAELESWD